MPDPAYQYVLTLASGTLTLNTNTAIPAERGCGAVLKFFRYLGIKGRDGLKLGEEGRRFDLEGWLHAASESDLETSRAALSTAAKNAEVGRLSYRGGAATIGNVILAEPPEFSEHYFESATVVGCHYRLVLDQLVPD